MKIKIITTLASITLAFEHQLNAQGTFVNLNFESPILPLNPVNFQVSAANAIPGWTAYTYGGAESSIVYNTVSTGAAAVSLQGPGSMEPIIQGNYSVILQGSSAGTPGSAAIGQTGTISATAESLIFWGYADLNDVSFGGQTLPLQLLGSTANYNIYGADISSFASQTGQLLFSAPPNREDLIDNIQFSTSPVPEPPTWALMICGASLPGLFRWLRKA